MAKFTAYTRHRLMDGDSWQKTKDSEYRQKLAQRRRDHLPTINRQYYHGRCKLMAQRIKSSQSRSNSAKLVLVDIDLLDELTAQLE